MPTVKTLISVFAENLSICWAHMSICWFFCTAAQMSVMSNRSFYVSLDLDDFIHFCSISSSITSKLNMGQVMKKMCLMPYANNKGADQPAHPRSLINTFVVRCLDSMMCILAISKVSKF